MSPTLERGGDCPPPLSLSMFGSILIYFILREISVLGVHQIAQFQAPKYESSLLWEGDTPSHTLPQSVASLPRNVSPPLLLSSIGAQCPRLYRWLYSIQDHVDPSHGLNLSSLLPF